MTNDCAICAARKKMEQNGNAIVLRHKPGDIVWIIPESSAILEDTKASKAKVDSVYIDNNGWALHVIFCWDGIYQGERIDILEIHGLIKFLGLRY